MYVDESGDTGLDGSPTEHFVLAGFVVHEADWSAHLERLVAYRRRMGAAFGLPMRAELHSSHLLTRPGPLVGIAKNDRLTIIRAFAKEVAALDGARCICVHVDKRGKSADYDVYQEIAPSAYMRRTGGKNYFERLGPVLLTKAATSDPRGIVRL